MKKFAKWGIGLFVAFVVLALVSGGSDNKRSTTVSEQASVESESADQTKEGKIEVVSHSVRDEGYGYRYIVGEVVNKTDTPASFIKVAVTYYDASNEVTNTEFGYAGETHDTPLQPQETVSFKVPVGQNNNFDHYKIDVNWN